MGNASLEFAIQAIKDEATKPLHLEIERLRAERDALKSQLYNSCEYERHDPEGCACPLGYRLTEVEAERDAAKAALYESCEDERHNELGWVCPLGHKLNEVEAERDALRAKLDSVRDVAVLMLDAIRLIEEGKPLPIEYMKTKLRATINAAIRGEEE